MHRIDHIIIGVRDLDPAAGELWDRYGLEAQAGGTHGGAGTANMIVPVGNDQFLELLTVSDPHSHHPIVRWLDALLADGNRLLGLALQPDDLRATALRLNEPIIDVERIADDGRRVAFRLTGTLGLIGDDILPFFVECTAGREWRCGFRAPRHRIAPAGVRWVELGTDERRVSKQLGNVAAPLVFVPGRPGVSAIALDIGDREVVLRF